MGRGLQMLCRIYGGFKINGETFVWDYHQEKPVKESDLLAMKKEDREKQKAASEKAKWMQVGMFENEEWN